MAFLHDIGARHCQWAIADRLTKLQRGCHALARAAAEYGVPFSEVSLDVIGTVGGEQFITPGTETGCELGCGVAVPFRPNLQPGARAPRSSVDGFLPSSYTLTRKESLEIRHDRRGTAQSLKVWSPPVECEVFASSLSFSFSHASVFVRSPMSAAAWVGETLWTPASRPWSRPRNIGGAASAAHREITR